MRRRNTTKPQSTVSAPKRASLSLWQQTRLLLGLAPALLLTACAPPGYDCKRGQACAPVHNTYNDAVRAQGSWRPVWNVRGTHFGKKKHRDHWFFSGLFSAKPKRLQPIRGSLVFGGPQSEAPVYQPPRPWRVWLGPWVDSTGDLHSGEYVWFTSPGHWFYDSRIWPLATGKGQGGARVGDHYVSDGVLSPVPPTELGFRPNLSQTAPGVLKSMTQPKVVHRHRN